MTIHKTLLITAALAAVVCVEGVATAAAKKRVVVLDVEGARNKNLERSLADLVGEEAKVVPSGDYRKAAKKLKATKLSPEHVAKVAAKLEVDGVLESLIIAEGGRYTLRLRLREGTSGRTIKKIALKLRAPALTGKMEDALADRLLDAIAELPRLETIEEMDGDPEEEAEIATSKMRKPRREAMAAAEDEDEAEESAPPPKKKAKAKPRRVASADDEEDFGSALEVTDPNDDEVAAADEGEDEEDDEAAEDDEDPAAEIGTESRRKVPYGDGASIAAGLSLIKRKLAFNSRADMLNPPQGYNGAPVPAASVDGELFPLSLMGKSGGLANVGIGFAAHKGIGLKTNVVVDDMTVALPTDETYYSIDARYRHKLGGRTLLVASLGMARLKFAIDRTNGEVDVPNNNYKYFHPGLEARFAATGRVTLAADARVFLITGTGGIEKAEEYGAAKMTGGEAGAGVEVLWGKRLVTRLGARMTLMAYQFTGDGLQTTDRDGDPGSVDVGGALDRFLQADLTAGYLF